MKKIIGFEPEEEGERGKGLDGLDCFIYIGVFGLI